VNAPFTERADQLALAFRILVATPRKNEDATLARGILDSAMKLRRERVRDVFEDQPDRLRLPAQTTQRRRVRVAPVVELRDCPPDPGLQLRADTRLGVDDARHGLQCNPG